MSEQPTDSSRHGDISASSDGPSPSQESAAPLRASISSVFLRLSFLTTAITALGLLTGPLQARALGPSARGNLAAITAVAYFLPVIAGMGLELFVAREAARGTSLGEIIGTAGAATVLVALILAPLGIPISAWLAHGRSTVHAFILIQFILLPILLPLLLLYYALVGLESWTRVMICRAIPVLGPAIVVIILFISHSMTVAAVATATIIASLVGLLPALYALPKIKTLRVRMSILRTALPFSLRTWLGTLAFLTNGRLDQLLMVGLASSRQLGLYAVAVTSTVLTGQVTSALGSPLLSRIAGGQRRLVPRALRTTLAVVIALNICTGIAVPFLLPLLFGSAFRDAVPMAWILLIAAVPLSATLVLTPAMVADGHPMVPARGEVATLLITVPGLILLVPPLGGVGAAVVSLVAYSLDAAYQLWASRRNFGGRLVEYVCPTMADLSWVSRRLFNLMKLPFSNLASR